MRVREGIDLLVFQLTYTTMHGNTKVKFTKTLFSVRHDLINSQNRSRYTKTTWDDRLNWSMPAQFPHYLLWKWSQQYSQTFDTVSKHKTTEFRKPDLLKSIKIIRGITKQTTKYWKAFGNSPEPWILWGQFSWRSPLSWKYPDSESWRSNAPVRSIVPA